MHGRNKFEGIGQRKWWEGVKDVETSTSVVEVPLYWQIPHRLIHTRSDPGLPSKCAIPISEE